MLTASSSEVVAAAGALHCACCGQRYIGYVPRCMACGQPREQTGELPLDKASLTKLAGTCRIGHLTDLHVNKDPLAVPTSLECLRRWLMELRDIGVDVVVISGDLVEEATDSDGLEAVRAALIRSGIAFCVVPGNHDIVTPGRPGPFEAVFGRYPRIERHAGVEFLLVDSNAGLPVEERTLLERGFGTFFCYTEGRVGSAQRDDLDATLEGDSMPRILVLHHHLVHQAPEAATGMGWAFPLIHEGNLGTMQALQDAEAVRRWAVRRGVRLVLHGHKHAMQRLGIHEGGLVVLNGGSSTTAVAGDSFAERRYRARIVDLLPDHRMHVRSVEMMF